MNTKTNKQASDEAIGTPQDGAQLEQYLGDLQAQLGRLTIERDDLATQLQEAQAKLQAAASPPKGANAGKGTHVRVCSASPAGSHRRAGRVWTKQPQDVALKDLSNEDLAALRSCPMTIVVDL